MNFWRNAYFISKMAYMALSGQYDFVKVIDPEQKALVVRLFVLSSFFISSLFWCFVGGGVSGLRVVGAVSVHINSIMCGVRRIVSNQKHAHTHTHTHTL
jgi:hypothetical protein